MARSKVNELKENLKDAKKKAKEKGKGKSNGKGKGKAPKTKEVEELETRLAEAEADVIKDTINDKTIDLLQVCLLKLTIITQDTDDFPLCLYRSIMAMLSVHIQMI